MNRVDAYPATVAVRDMPEVTSNQLGFRELIDIILRRWLLITLITILVAALAVGSTFLMTKKYTATMRLKIDPAARTATDATDQRMTSPQADQSKIDTETQIIQSRDIAVNVTNELGLDKDPEFAADGTATSPAAAFDQVIENVQKGLTVTREGENYVVDVAFKSQDPDKSARIANAFAKHYLTDSIANRTGKAARQSAFLDERLKSLGGEISAIEAKIAEYRGQSGIVVGGTQGTITDQQIGPLSTQLAEAEAQAAAARASLVAARDQMARGNLGAVSSVLTSNTITELRRQRAEASKDQAEVNARYGERHPESIRATQQIATIDAALKEEAQRIVAGLDASARAADASAASLRAQLSRLRGQQATDTRASVTADALERQAKAKQAVYDQLAQTAQQTGQAERNDESTATVVETAVAPLKPSFPNKVLFAALGLILGLILGLTAALLLEFFTNTVHKGDDIERSLGIPFITSVPRLSSRQRKSSTDGTQLAPADFVIQNPMSTYAEAMRTIRNTLLLTSSEGPRVLAVMSALPGEGKTSVSLSLARIMALAGDRVLLVECDLRRGGLQELNLPSANGGLIAVLNGEVSVDQAIVRDPSSSLDLLPVQGPSFTAVDMFSGDRMRELIAELAGRYDFLVLDNAPVLAVADARIVASLADASLFVVRSENTPMRAARTAINLLRQDGSVILGGALTMTERPKRLGQNDPAYFYSRYRAYHQG